MLDVCMHVLEAQTTKNDTEGKEKKMVIGLLACWFR